MRAKIAAEKVSSSGEVANSLEDQCGKEEHKRRAEGGHKN